MLLFLWISIYYVLFLKNIYLLFIISKEYLFIMYYFKRIFIYYVLFLKNIYLLCIISKEYLFIIYYF